MVGKVFKSKILEPDNPFYVPSPWKVKVTAVKNDWVQYQYVDGTPSFYSMKYDGFIHVYELDENVPETKPEEIPRRVIR